MSSPAPEPPVALPPGLVVHVRGRGEFFVRDSGGSGPAVLLLHGWMFASDLNWWPHYRPLADAGYRVLAMDHRGHGRGLRTSEPFSLRDCASDAAALVEGGQVDAVTVTDRARLVVVIETAAALAGGFVGKVVLAQRGVSWRWAPRTVQPCGAG